MAKIPEKSLADDPTLQQKRYNSELMPLCACGCGEKVKGYRSKYLKHHCYRDPNWKPEKKKECKLCECGCGEKVNHPNARFINGHWLKKLKKEGKINEFVCIDAHSRMSNETYMEVCNKRSENMKENTIWKNSKGFTGKTHSDYYKEICRQRALKLKSDPNSEFAKTQPNCGIGKTGNRIIGDKSLFFRSTWEANFARILNYLKIEFEYEYKSFKYEDEDGDIHLYRPDFYIPSKDKYYEIKGYVTELSLQKIEKTLDNYDIKIVLVNPKFYKYLERKYKFKISNWE